MSVPGSPPHSVVLNFLLHSVRGSTICFCYEAKLLCRTLWVDIRWYVFRAFAGCPNLTLFQSCCFRYHPGRFDFCLAHMGYGRTREEMGRLPTPGEPTDRCYNCRPAPGDRLLHARLDRGVQSHQMVCSDARNNTNRLCGQLGVRFTAGEFFVLARGPSAYSVCRAT